MGVAPPLLLGVLEAGAGEGAGLEAAEVLAARAGEGAGVGACLRGLLLVAIAGTAAFLAACSHKVESSIGALHMV